MFRPREGATYVVTGVPVVTEALADAVQGSILVLLVAAVLVMAATLTFVFRTRLRLLPLALALAAAAVTFGALSLAGGSLTMASIAVLPVLIGLAVDYAIQFQARFDEQRARRRGPPGRRPRGRAGGRVPRPPRRAAPRSSRPAPPRRWASWCCCSRRCRWCAASACCSCSASWSRSCWRIVAGFAALVRFGGGGRAPRPSARAAGRARRHPRCEAARERLAGRSWRALGVALARPRKVLAIGLAVAVLGLALDTQSEVVSDIQQLVPQDLQALRDVDELQEATGVSGEIDVAVRADDITRPEVLRWMTRLPERRAARARLSRRASAARRSTTRPSSARRCRCPTCSARRARDQAEGAASCCARCRPTSPRA